MSTTLPRHLVNHVHGDSRFYTNNTVKGIKALEQSKKKAGRLQGGTSRISADPSFAFMPAGSAWLKIFFKNHLKKFSI